MKHFRELIFKGCNCFHPCGEKAGGFLWGWLYGNRAGRSCFSSSGYLAQKLFLILLVLFSLRAGSQSHLRFEHISDRYNFSNNAVYSIMQDHHGFIWIATEDGLNRFDGYETVVFRNNPDDPGSLSSSWIYDVFEDSKGQIWASNKGINLLDQATGRFRRYMDYGKDSLTIGLDYIQAINEDSRGQIWFGGNRLHRLDPSGREFKSFPLLNNSLDNSLNIYFIHEYTQDRLWIGANQGLFSLDFPTGQLQIDERIGLRRGPLGEDNLRGYQMDGRGNLWILDSENLLRMNAGGKGLDTVLANIITWEGYLVEREIVEDKEGQIWVGETAAGLIRLDPITGKVKTFTHNPDDPNSIKADIGFNLLVDRQGSLWIGGINGLDYLPADFFSRQSEQTGPSEFRHFQIAGEADLNANRRMIRSFLLSRDGSFWIGTYDGVYKYSKTPGGKLNLVDHFFYDPNREQSLSWNEVRALLETGNGDIWIATRKGLNRIDAGTGQIERIRFPEFDGVNGLTDQVFWSLCEDGQGNIWIGTQKNGVIRLDPVTRESRRFLFDGKVEGSLAYNEILKVYQDRHGRIWVGAYGGGLNLYNPVDDSFIRFMPDANDPGAISGDIIWSVFQDSQDRIWVGTQNGLNQLLPAEDGKPGAWRFEHWMEEDGLGNNTVYGILEDQLGRLWLSTLEGLSCFDPKDGIFLNFSQEDGLSINSATPNAYFRDPATGEMFFGGVNGYDRFQPESFRTDTFAPEVVISSIIRYNVKEQNGKPIVDYFPAGKSSFRFSHQDDIIIFNLALLNLRNPEKNQYEYLLEGLQTNWVSLGTDRKITFSGLGSGKYFLRVRGANHNGIKTREELRVAVIILPPWWWTLAAQIIYALLFLAAILGIYRYQLNKKLIEQEARQLKEMDEVKSRFFTNISHEFRTPLTVISGMVTQIREQPEQWMEKGMDLIHRNSNQLLSLINQILDLRKLESGALKVNLILGNIVPFLHYLADSFTPMAQSKGLRIHFLSAVAELEMDYDPDKILQILSNLLSNAIKYTPGPGDIYLQINHRKEAEKETLIVQVRDTGKGIGPEALPYIFDRFYQVADLVSQKPQGTGIGLALTKELVALLRGTINVDSAPGKGTTFTVILPITRKALVQDGISAPIPGDAVAEDPVPALFPQQANIAALAPKDRLEEENGSPTLLIVEDNPDVRLYLTAFLERHYRILTAENGQQGIDLAIDQVPDLIVSDVMMPVKDGLELCDTLKNDERTSHIPIILLTAKADYDSRIRGLRKGADVYLAKPFEQEELLVRLEQLLVLREKLRDRFRNRLYTAERAAPESSMDEPFEMEDAFLQKLRGEVFAHIAEEDFGIVHLQRALGISRTQLHNKIKALTAQSTTEFIRSIRLDKARELLKTTDLNVSEVGYEVGFSNPAYFSRIFTEAFGESPTNARRG